MSKKSFIGVIVVALAVVLAAGGVLASNMGFKLNYPLKKTAAGVSASGTNTLSLPDNRQANMDFAHDLFNDIGGKAQVTNVKRYIISNDTTVPYTGRNLANVDFPLSMGEGYFVVMVNDINYVVVGSHNPGVAVGLKKGDGGVTSLSGTNFYSMPYNFTGTLAADLFNDIGGKAQVTSVKRYIISNDTTVPYTGRNLANTNFPLTPGEAYFVLMVNNINYIPSHY
jgi:hypothetical protein